MFATGLDTFLATGLDACFATGLDAFLATGLRAAFTGRRARGLARFAAAGRVRAFVARRADLFFAPPRRPTALREALRFLPGFARLRAFPRTLPVALRLAIALVLSSELTLTVSGKCRKV